MKKLFLSLLLLAMVSNLSFSQERWSAVKPPLGKYVKLPAVVQTWDNPNKLPSIHYTPTGVLSVAANFRVLPNSNQQDEIILTSNPSFPNLLYGSSNSTAGSTYSQGVYVSTNGGLNWYGTDIMPNCPIGASDPAPAIDKNGTFVFTTLNTAVTNNAMIGQYSINYGVNWSSPFTIPGGGPSDKNMTATDDVPTSPFYGRTYTVWTKWTSPYPIMISYTTNGGVSWSSAAQINSPSVLSQGCDVVVGPGGVVYVTWSKQSTVSTGCGFAKSTDGGVTWSVNETAFSVTGMRSSSFNGWGVRVNDFPRMAVDKSGGPNNGRIYIVDCEKNSPPAGSDPDVVLHRSTDGGATWMTRVRVNQDVANNGKVQFFPAVCIDGSGGVNVIYYDNRNYPSVGDSCETFVSRSIDGGSTFTDILVSDHRWKPQGEPGLGSYMGDYIGITAGNGKVWPFWFDNKSGSFQAWTAPIDLGPSIAHTPLTNTELTSGNRAVNCVITPAGSPITPSSVKLYYSKDNPTLTSNVTMTNTGGDNWTGNLPLSGAGLYRYYITATDGLARTATYPAGAPANTVQFTASPDITKPVITHTAIGSTPKTTWPVAVTATVTDNIGIDSAWVIWRINSGVNKRFKLLNTSGSSFSALFNSINSDVNINDVIYYRIFAQDNSSNHNRDSSALYNFTIINLTNVCIGTGTTSSNYPFTTYWMDGRTQMLFTAAELTAAGIPANAVFTKIGFNVLTADPAPMSGFNVKFQATTMTSLTSFVTSGTWVTGFSGTYTVPGTGTQNITMQNNYIWNGISNLLIEICYDNSAYTQYSTVASTSASGMTWGYYTDNAAGCTMTGGTAQANRPNTCFTFTVNVGVNPSGSELPKVYSLSQNYPNPFNPVTKINFALPKQGFVSLKIYDVLGREVRNLVSEVKSAGTYSVDFNASEFSSGIYFYKLEADGFSDIKRMMLIK
jgi:hypothetical protein